MARLSYRRFALVLTSVVAVVGCRDVERFSSSPADHYEGAVVQGSFVRAGIGEDASMCLRLDASSLEAAPGSISTSDGRFRETPLRPVPQLFRDPLSTFTFGEGRVRNVVYAAAPLPLVDGGAPDGDVVVVLSLLQSGDVEVRLLRGAPPASGATGTSTGPDTPIFAVFPLTRRTGSCSF